MDSNKKPRAPEEEERGVQKIQLNNWTSVSGAKLTGYPSRTSRAIHVYSPVMETFC